MTKDPLALQGHPITVPGRALPCACCEVLLACELGSSQYFAQYFVQSTCSVSAGVWHNSSEDFDEVAFFQFVLFPLSHSNT